MSAASTQKPCSGDAGPPRKNLPAGKRGGPSSNSESPTSQDDTRKALTFHPLANIFPLLEGAEFEAFDADERSLGIFPNLKRAADAVSAAGVAS